MFVADGSAGEERGSQGGKGAAVSLPLQIDPVDFRLAFHDRSLEPRVILNRRVQPLVDPCRCLVNHTVRLM